jgi:hypothetical protein
MVIAIRRTRALAAAILIAGSLSCFEQPITESMEIRFLAANAAMVRVTVRLADPDRFKDSKPARDRIEAARRAIVEGRDPWSVRLASMAPAEERITWDRKAGQVVRLDQKVLVADADDVRKFFRDTLVHATVTRTEGAAEFMLTPWPGSRADGQERAALEGKMERWGAAIVGYVDDGRRLYDYLDANPDRARPCFCSLFKDFLPDETKGGCTALSPRDEGVVKPFNDAMGHLLGLFDLPADEAYSVEELSRLVYDPFPAPLTVRVPGPILEAEGFEAGTQGALRVRPIGLWSAFTRLDDRWIAPDPAVVYYRHLGHDKAQFDLDGFLALRRSVTPPSGPAEVLAALRDEMRPAPVYRVRWSTADLKEPEVEGDIWDIEELQ